MGENFGGGGFDVGEREDGDLTKMEAAGKPPIHSLQSDCYLPNRFAVRPET